MVLLRLCSQHLCGNQNNQRLIGAWGNVHYLLPPVPVREDLAGPGCLKVQVHLFSLPPLLTHMVFVNLSNNNLKNPKGEALTASAHFFLPVVETAIQLPSN